MKIIEKTVKVPKEIASGAMEGVKDLTKKATGFKEPAKQAVSVIAGFPLELGLEYLSNMITNAIGSQNYFIKMGIKIGTPIAISSLFIGAKLPFGKLVVIASVTSIIIALGREVLRFIAPNLRLNLGLGGLPAEIDAGDLTPIGDQSTEFDRAERLMG